MNYQLIFSHTAEHRGDASRHESTMWNIEQRREEPRGGITE
ncbi:hypothetical protein [Nesterenkonia suensis]